jgi:hypothetical protein
MACAVCEVLSRKSHRSKGRGRAANLPVSHAARLPRGIPPRHPFAHDRGGTQYGIARATETKTKKPLCHCGPGHCRNSAGLGARGSALPEPLFIVAIGEAGMAENPQERRAAIETMIAWRQARDASKPGSKEYREFDQKYREAEATFNNLGKD